MKNNTTEKNNSSLIVTVVFIVVVIVLLVFNFNSLISANEYRDKIERLEKDLDNLEYKNDKLQYELDKKLDYDEIRRIAKEELGLVDPNEEHYVVG